MPDVITVADLVSPARADALRRVRAYLELARYDRDSITAAGIDPGLGVRSTDVPALLLALDGGQPLRSLVRLFLLHQPLPVEEAERRLGAGLATLAAAGLVERDDADVRATASITPWREWLVVHDPDPAGELWPEHVAGPNPATEALASLVVDDRVDAALDLGTGSGVLALLLAADADRVTATDINPRALELAAMNLVLNGVDNVDVVGGSLFEPVADRSFGTIVSNPPFVIAPESGLVFRHSPFPRDDLSRLVVSGVADHLADGGFGHVLGNWIQPAGGSLREPIERWLAGRGCDALVLVHAVETPLDYAARWNVRRQQLAPDTYAGTLAAWTAAARREGIDRITSAAVILRRRAGRNWLHDLELTGATRGHAGDHVRAIVEGVDHLQAHPTPDALLASTIRMRTGHRLDQSMVARGDGYDVQPGRLSMTEGLAVEVAVAPHMVPVLLRLDGTAPLGRVVDEVVADGGGERSAVAEAAVVFARDLLGRGLAEPAEVAP